MSIATVVTMGFGSFGSVNLVPTIGYAASVVVPGTVMGIDEAVAICPDDSECLMVQDSREVRFDAGGDNECRLAGRGWL